MAEFIRCSCTRVNDPWRRFCGACGVALAPACTSCKFVNGKFDRFCGGCGASLGRANVLEPPPTDRTIPLDVIEEV